MTRGPAAGRMPLSLLPELLRAMLRRAMRGPRVWWRRNWFYRRLLKGPLPDRIVFHPYDALPRRLEDADALLHGRFRFDGETVEVKDGSVFDKAAPSQRWAEGLHGFAWLPPLSAAGGDAARTLATNLISQWIKRNGRYAEPASLAHVLASPPDPHLCARAGGAFKLGHAVAFEGFRLVARSVVVAGAHCR